MNPKLRTLFIVLLIVIVPAGAITGGYFIYKKRKSNNANNSPDESVEQAGATTNTKSASTPDNNDFPLKRNPLKKSDLVKRLQEMLNNRIADLKPPAVPYYGSKPITELVEDGYYGDRTAAVVKFLFPKTDGKEVTKEMFDSLDTRNFNRILYF